MLTTPFSEQIRHRANTVKYKLDELLDQLGVFMASEFVKYTDPVANFQGDLQVNGQQVITSSYLTDNDYAKYSDPVPTFTDTTAIGIPVGAAAQRPACGSPGYLRYNTDLGAFEGFDGTDWYRFRVTDLQEDPEYTEQFVVNAGQFWEYDSWCIFGNETDARNRIIQLSRTDPVVGSPTEHMWIDPSNTNTGLIAIKDNRFIRVYNPSPDTHTYYIRVI